MGLDADGDGQLTNGSVDRITETQAAYAQEDNAWWWVTENSVYNQDNVDTPVTAGTRKVWLSGDTGVTGVVTALTKWIDSNQNQTKTVVTVDSANKTDTRLVHYPDSTDDEVTVTVNRLVQSVTSKTGLLTQYGYDALARPTKFVDARKGTAETVYYASGVAAKGKVYYVKDADGRQTTYTYDANGRLSSVEDPAGKKQYFDYNDRGQQIRTWGEATYPAAREYDDLGQLKTLKTYRDPGGVYTWTGSAWPSPSDTDAEVTQWAYDPASGLLTSKTYADGTHVDYAYSAQGRLATRTWARGVTTTYAYYGPTDSLKTGELKGVTYSDGTPELTYSYNRLGQPATVTDAVGTRTFTYNDAMQPLSESINGSGGGLFSKTITRSYQGSGAGEVPGRYAGLSIGNDYAVAYGYDTVGRLNNVSGPGLPSGGVVYGYVTNADLVNSLSYSDGASTLASATWLYGPEATPVDHRDVLSSIENKTGATTVSNYGYTYDPLGRRASVVNQGTAFAASRLNKWGYNDRSELTSSYRHEGIDPDNAGTEVTAERRGYAYDNIGNRQSHTDGPVTPPGATYTASNLNQYEKITPPNEVLSYDPDGNLIRTASAADFNADGAVNLLDFNVFDGCFTGPIGTVAAGCEKPDLNGDGHVDLKDFLLLQTSFGGPGAPSGNVPATLYTWDGENRLIAVEPQTPTTGAKKVTCQYDYLGRRVRKEVRHWDGGNWTIDSDQRFVYDGWNVVMVLNSAGVAQQKFTWGLDLSGTIRGAGGIGGLLAVEETSGSSAGSYWFFYDGNGNVGQVIRASDRSVVARYEYDPYGNTLTAEGTYASANVFRFSTKWNDTETGLYYYGYRYYSPRLGRWVNRDPLGETGGKNLYGFAGSRPTYAIDPNGQFAEELMNLALQGRFLSNQEIQRAQFAGDYGLTNATSSLLYTIQEAGAALIDPGAGHRYHKDLSKDTCNKLSQRRPPDLSPSSHHRWRLVQASSKRRPMCCSLICTSAT